MRMLLLVIPVILVSCKTVGPEPIKQNLIINQVPTDIELTNLMMMLEDFDNADRKWVFADKDHKTTAMDKYNINLMLDDNTNTKDGYVEDPPEAQD